eukprot:CAMPEP_0197035526 /NCGR_PEP_ID=MMETSP1384-20130603/13299_1 /TAXON_ID=29189 /ORGANISM="Ammonia sp." /LENGTH=513 /DNA_ID=CAMNT_0042465599 /DNA_START=69 /DNA_END=1607 /DNA_ORIENTATION=-
MSSRTTRSSGRRTQPNKALYVGYVEDDETPEMIMKKFSEMERMVEAAKKAHRAQKKTVEEKAGNNAKSSKAEMSDSEDDDEDGGKAKKSNQDAALTEEQLVSLFNDTSYYSINSLKRNNDIMFQKQTVDEEGFVVGIDDPDYEKLMFEVDYDVADTDMARWMEQNDDDYIGDDQFWEDDDGEEEEPESSKAVQRAAGSKRSRSRGMASSSKKERFARFSGHAIGSSSLRRVEGTDGKVEEKKIFCHEPNYLKVPAYPIPRSWLKPIKALDARDIDEYTGYYYAEKDIASMARKNDYFFSNNAEKQYRAILMDPPFDLNESPISMRDAGDNKGDKISLDAFRKLPIGDLIPNDYGGMLFIWVPSELTMEINDICESWGFLLVEHATWIMRNLSYQIENRESNLLGVSKCNLMLYRRTKKNGKTFTRLELRHQRTSDSYFDFVRYHTETGRELKSDYHYNVIETLLPDLDQREKGQALFLWAPKNEKRDGWTCIADSKQLEVLMQNKPNMDVGDW